MTKDFTCLKSYQNIDFLMERKTKIPHRQNITKIPHRQNITKIPHRQNITKIPHRQNITKIPHRLRTLLKYHPSEHY